MAKGKRRPTARATLQKRRVSPVTARFEALSANNRYRDSLAGLVGVLDRARVAAGMTPGQLAKKAGVAPGTVKRLLEGKTIAPQYPTLCSIAWAVDAELTLQIEEGRRKIKR